MTTTDLRDGRHTTRPRAARWLAVLAAAGATSFGLCPRAIGQTQPSAADVAAARDLGREGVKLADAGNCAGAIDKLARAEKLYHAPTILGRLGECQIAIGKIVLGTESLRRVVNEQLAPNAPAAFKTAQERAKKALDAALPKVAKLKIHVAGVAAGTTPTVKVDGETVPDALLDTDRPTDPGTRLVEAGAAGYKSTSQSVTLAEGGSQSVTLTLEAQAGAPPVPVPVPIPGPTATAAPPPTQPAQPPGPVPPPATAPTGPPPGPQPPPGPEAPKGGSSAGGWLIGIGVAGLAAGTVFGLLTQSKKKDLDKVCVDKQCPEDSKKAIDEMGQFAMVSNISFGVGAAGVLAGIIVLASSGGSQPAASPPSSRGGAPGGFAATPIAARGPAVRPWIGAGSAGLAGTF